MRVVDLRSDKTMKARMGGSKTGGGGLAASSYQAAAEEARKANIERYQQGLGIYDEIIGRYQPGGQYGQGAMALYEQGKQKAMAQAQQSLVSSGLTGTTVAAGLPMKYEQEVGTPFRLQLEERRMGALSEAQLGKAGFIERREDIYPSAELFAGLQSQAATGGGVVSGGSRGYKGYSSFMDYAKHGFGTGGGAAGQLSSALARGKVVGASSGLSRGSVSPQSRFKSY